MKARRDKREPKKAERPKVKKETLLKDLELNQKGEGVRGGGRECTCMCCCCTNP